MVNQYMLPKVFHDITHTYHIIPHLHDRVNMIIMGVSASGMILPSIVANENRGFLGGLRL